MEWEATGMVGEGPGLCGSSQHQPGHQSHAMGKPLSLAFPTSWQEAATAQSPHTPVQLSAKRKAGE